MATGTRRAVVAPVDDYQAQDDMRTLMRAHQIKSDPKRHSAAKMHAKSQLAAMQKVMDTDEAADRKQGVREGSRRDVKTDKGKPY